jgi:putative transposase
MTIKRLQGYRFSLRPKQKHMEHLNQSLGANRFVWNKLLSMNLHRLKNGFGLLWYNEMAWFITLWKKSEEYQFLNDVPSQSLQQTAKALERAFKDAFDKKQRKKHLPVYKHLGKNEAGIKYPQGILLDQNNQVIKLPKLGWVKYRASQKIEGKIKNVTISRHAGKYTVSIQTEREVVQVRHASVSAIGIDMGIERFATLSDGNFIAPLHPYRKLEKALSIEQRKLKCKKRFSNNWKKQQTVIGLLHTKIANVRRDFLHKASSSISKNHAMIVLEDLKICNMSKSAKGSVDSPGRQIAQKSGLNKSILDQGWGEFKRQLIYKSDWGGGLVVHVSPQYTSQTCPCCHFVSRENRKTQSAFLCIECGYQNNADVVGAINILRAGHAQLACEVSDLKIASSKNQLSTCS